MKRNDISSNEKWQPALKKARNFASILWECFWLFIFKGIPYILTSSIAKWCYLIFFGYMTAWFVSWQFAKALYPWLPTQLAHSIKAAQQRDFAMSHEFLTSSPELYLSNYVLMGAFIIALVLWGIRNFLAYIFKPKELLDKVASTEKELKAVQEELRRLKSDRG